MRNLAQHFLSHEIAGCWPLRCASSDCPSLNADDADDDPVHQLATGRSRPTGFSLPLRSKK